MCAEFLFSKQLSATFYYLFFVSYIQFSIHLSIIFFYFVLRGFSYDFVNMSVLNKYLHIPQILLGCL